MNRYLPLSAGAAVLLASGVVHGLLTDRWGVSAAVETSCQRLAMLPVSVGDWDGTPTELSERQLTVSEAAGHVARRYVQRGSKREVSLVVLCGRRGPLSVHQPDVCYTGTGYHLAAAPEKWTLPGTTSSFWMARFARVGHEAEPLRVFWAWSGDGTWVAADKPRIDFGARPALYKFYLVEQMPRPDEPIEESAAVQFLRVMQPELHRHLGGRAEEHAAATDRN